MTYEAEFGYYINCSISGTFCREIEARNIEVARKTAESIALAIEEEDSKLHPDDDIWVCVEEVYGG